MRVRRQLLMWTSVILALIGVLFNQLRNPSAIAGHVGNEVQLDLTRIDLASINSNSNLLEPREKSTEESIAENQLTEATTEALGYKIE